MYIIKLILKIFNIKKLIEIKINILNLIIKIYSSHIYKNQKLLLFI